MLLVSTVSAIPPATSVVVETEVKPGYISQNVKMCYPREVYNALLKEVKSKGYSSLQQYFMSKIPPITRGKVTFSEVDKGDYVVVSIDAKYLSFKEAKCIGNITINKTKYHLTFIDRSFMNQAHAEDAWLHYYLEMPGEIVNSNAEVVKGNKAEWHLKGKDIGIIYAMARVKKIPFPSSDSSVLIAIVSILVAVFVLNKRR
jgi:hypothetical protein